MPEDEMPGEENCAAKEPADGAADRYDGDEQLDLFGAGGGEPVAPREFPIISQDVEADFRCPKCRYEWSGKPRP